jgi:hypothetical protein
VNVKLAKRVLVFSFVHLIHETVVVVVELWETRSVFGAEFSIVPQPNLAARAKEIQLSFLNQQERLTAMRGPTQ